MYIENTGNVKLLLFQWFIKIQNTAETCLKHVWNKNCIAFAMYLQCFYNVCAMFVQCVCNVCAMLLQCSCNVIAMYCNVCAMLLQCITMFLHCQMYTMIDFYCISRNVLYIQCRKSEDIMFFLLLSFCLTKVMQVWMGAWYR